MPNKTRLDDDAQIYHPKEKQTEKEKLSKMSLEGKLSYLWEYYRLHALAVVAVIAIIIYFVYGILNPKITPQFFAAVVNNTIDEKVLQQYADDYAKHLQLNPKRNNVELDPAFHLETPNQYSITMDQALTSYIIAGQVDAIIAPESKFREYVYNGNLKILTDQLPTDLYSSLTDQFYMGKSQGEKEKSVYGIYLTNTKLFMDHANNKDPYVLGIVVNCKHVDNTIEFIRYIFNEY